MNYLNELPDDPHVNALGLECLNNCQGMYPRCPSCPKDDRYISTSDRVFKIALGILSLIVLAGVFSILFVI
jgi:hypothetical protein